MFGARGFRAREAAANYKRRERRLVSEEVRLARASNLPGHSYHGDPEGVASAAVLPTQEQAAKASAAAKAAAEKAAAEKEAADKAAAAKAAAEKEAAEKAAAEKAAADEAAKKAKKAK